MKSFSLFLFGFIIFLFGVILGKLLFASAPITQVSSVITERANDPHYFTTNEEFIAALGSTINATDTDEVFSYVFSMLPSNVTIFPTENYYYFKFVANGKVYGGAMSLLAKDRDSGVFGFGYTERKEQACNENFIPFGEGGGKEYTAEDGVIVDKISDFSYAVTYESKTVTFNFYHPPLVPSHELDAGDVYLGPVLDESGVHFDLLYSNFTNTLFLVLDEQRSPSMKYWQVDEKSIIDKRTGFAFFADEELDRKILIGVSGDNVLINNWYDGPHDQMPDNFIATGQLDLRSYVQMSMPYLDIVDEYLSYGNETEGRVAIAPYSVYYGTQDVSNLVSSCEATYPNKAQFIACVTYQTFGSPPAQYYPNILQTYAGD